MQRILFVCLGNICRSPLAQGVFEHLVAGQQLNDVYHIDSAGTASYHVGERPHWGSQQVAAAHGISLDGQRARQVQPEDYESFDWIIAMDQSNLNDLMRAAPHQENCLHLLLEFSGLEEREVHDPYYDSNFAKTFHQVRAGCQGLFEAVQNSLDS